MVLHGVSFPRRRVQFLQKFVDAAFAVFFYEMADGNGRGRLAAIGAYSMSFEDRPGGGMVGQHVAY